MVMDLNKVEEIDAYFSDPHNYSIEIMRQEWEQIKMILFQENEALKKEIAGLKTRIVDVSGWKGKDEIEIIREPGPDGNWLINEHRKDKDTGEIAESTHVIPHKNVKVVWAIIKKICPRVNDKTKYREVAPYLIRYYDWTDVDLESLQGGRNRSSKLFPGWYFPVKVLEHLKYIHYGGRGTITRLK